MRAPQLSMAWPLRTAGLAVAARDPCPLRCADACPIYAYDDTACEATSLYRIALTPTPPHIFLFRACSLLPLAPPLLVAHCTRDSPVLCTWGQQRPAIECNSNTVKLTYNNRNRRGRAVARPTGQSAHLAAERQKTRRSEMKGGEGRFSKRPICLRAMLLSGAAVGWWCSSYLRARAYCCIGSWFQSSC